MKAEEWRPIPGYSRYEASSEGRVRMGVQGKAGPLLAKGDLLSMCKNGRGYLHVGVYSDTRRATASVHKLVALAFLGPAPEAYTVNHKDGDITNNRAGNLEYMSRANNRAHGIRMGRVPGKKPGNRNLTHHEVATIRGRKEAGERVADIARDYPAFHPETIRRASVNRLGLTPTGKKPHRLQTLT
jgi:hypothetical protein